MKDRSERLACALLSFFIVVTVLPLAIILAKEAYQRKEVLL